MSTVALIQLSAQVPASSDDAIDLAAERIDSVRSADLIVLPEVWYPGYFSFDSYVAAASQTPSMMERFSDIARSAAKCLHVGSLIEADGDRHFNTSVMFGPDGQVIGRYRKMHLFGYGSREQELLTPGSDVVVVDTPLGRLGMAVCYDLRFPELFRRMTEKGAIGFVVASAWPHPRVEAWSTLLRARAIENQAVMAACNGVGPTDSGAVLCGRSAIVDAWGVTIGELGSDPDVLVREVDFAAVGAARSRFPALADRRLLGDPDNDLIIEPVDGAPVRFSAKRLILAGYTGRDAAAVASYIAKLEHEGIAPPSEVPSYFVLGADRLTTDTAVETTSAESCGEVEYALLIDDDEIYVAVASDHTDRALESVDIPASKQSCVKVISPKVWRLADVEDHWDDLTFEARTPAAAESAYQSGPVAALRPPAELMALVEERFGGPMAGTVILSGTIAAATDFQYHSTFEVALTDPTMGRKLATSYTVKNVLEEI
ncbi:MAG: DUF2848 family protein [Ilumatobacteraceae bacterium]